MAKGQRITAKVNGQTIAVTAENTPRLMKFMHKFGLITARDPKDEYHAMTDVIHKVLNDITVDDWSIIIGGDSHTRMSKGVAFGADSGTVALALATAESPHNSARWDRYWSQPRKPSARFCSSVPAKLTIGGESQGVIA